MTVTEAWLSLRGLPFCYHFYSYLNGSQSWLPVEWDLEETKCQRVEGQRKQTPLEVTTEGPGLPSCTPGCRWWCPLSKDWAACRYRGRGHRPVMAAAPFGGSGWKKPLKREDGIELGTQRWDSRHSGGCGTAGTRVGVDACRQLATNSQPENVPQDFLLFFLSFLVSNNEQGESQTVAKIAHPLPQTCLA